MTDKINAKRFSVEEVTTVELTYQDICTLLESGTVQPSSELNNKLRAARDTFLREPKVYGKGLKRRTIA